MAFTNFIHAPTCPLLWWWYDDVMVWWMFIFLQKCFECLSQEVCTCIWNNFFGSLHSGKIILVIYTRSSADKLFTFFTIGNLLWYVQEHLNINHENICTNYFPQPARYFVMQYLFLGLCFLVFQACDTLLNHVFYISIHADLVYWLTWSHIFSVPIWLLCSWSNICFCNVKDMIIHLLYIALPSIIARLHLTGQYLHKLGSNSS